MRGPGSRAVSLDLRAGAARDAMRRLRVADLPGHHGPPGLARTRAPLPPFPKPTKAFPKPAREHVS